VNSPAFELKPLFTKAGQPHRPIVAVVAGSGQVAHYAQEAGADLLIALTAGFFRNLGAGSLASLMPYANANELTERLLREQILPRRRHAPIIAGVLASDPLRPLDETLRRLRELGVQGVTNWPAIGFVDGQLRAMLEDAGWGVDAEVELLRAARRHGLAPFGFALESDAARRFAEAGADGIILDLGLTRSLDDVRERRDQLQQAIVRLQAMVEAVKSSGRSPLLLVFGGPVASADDFEQVLRQCAVDGFAGGSIFERLPVQDVVMATVRRFKSIAIPGALEHFDNRLEELIGASPPMKDVFHLIQQIAPYDVNVCIEGETGTGKELVASLLHRHSARRHRPFITLNCGAIPETLLESELFGHEKGAFTGAHRQRLGKFELANSGTLFLDEIGDLSPHGQVALLRAIQQREITRVGGEKPIPVDARIITASHQSLPTLVQHGKFRADLFYRLNHFTIRLPALRERKEDLPLLCESILSRLNVELDRDKRGFTGRFLEKLEAHSWPGNVRELEHVVRQATVLEEGAILTGSFFAPRVPFTGPAPTDDRVTAKGTPGQSRAEIAQAAVSNFHGNKTHAAASLGITRKTLYDWLGRS
jgi:DNA-binding NtrC family response regulator/predicted TIM-barrel enzyme